MATRRNFLQRAAQFGGALALPPLARSAQPAATAPPDQPGVLVNDVQSQLNATTVRRIIEPTSIDDLQAYFVVARVNQLAVSICGGRHAMGGQQFGRDTLLFDLRKLTRVSSFDKTLGHITVGAGIQWPELIDYLHRAQPNERAPWSIREKQTGVDRVTLAGSLSSNTHGRRLNAPPIVGDVESFVLVTADGKVRTCSRRENQELFSLAIGGYGLFGAIAEVTLRLERRTKVERIVDVIAVKDLLPAVDDRLRQDFVWGDCQYSTDLDTDADAHQGVFSCYRPVAPETPLAAETKRLSGDDWRELYRLARTDKKRAFQCYSDYYRTTSGQIYWSDTHQLAGAFDDYRQAVDPKSGTELITEVYVRRDAFVPFLADVRRDFLEHKVDMTYGTIRFIQRDVDSFLPWAVEDSVCIVCNLHVTHTEQGKAKAAADFRRIITRAIQHRGRYYLTYHRFADRKQVESCYPKFTEFLKLKRKYDPQERLQSDWYRHYRTMFADLLG